MAKVTTPVGPRAVMAGVKSPVIVLASVVVSLATVRHEMVPGLRR